MTQRLLLVLVLAALGGGSLTIAQGPPAAGQALAARIDAYVAQNQRAMLTELTTLLRISSVRGDVEGLRRNATVVRDALPRRGLTSSLVETPSAPLVIGDLRVPGAARTLLLYAHYDGMPVVPTSWQQATPFTPVLRAGRLEDGAREVPNADTLTRFEPDWRLYARAAADDKAPIVALLTALDALKANGVTPTWNIKVLLEGDEESGSTGLTAVVPQVKDQLRADLMLFLDGPSHASGRPTLVFGNRGNLGIELTVYGPRVELHSGHYGNWIPNPAMRLVRLLASMKDDDGRVLVGGFYDGLTPLTPEEQALLRAVPDDPDALLDLFGVAAPERNVESLQEALQRPSLNIRGFSSAVAGANASNVIPDRAIASVDVRLVKETPAAQLLEKIRVHIRAQGFHVVDADPDDQTRRRYRDIVKLSATPGTEAYRSSLTSPEARMMIAALTSAHAAPPVVIRTSGGTVPAALLNEALGAPIISLPTVNFDNNQHSHNENVRLGHLFTAVKTIAAAMTAR